MLKDLSLFSKTPKVSRVPSSVANVWQTFATEIWVYKQIALFWLCCMKNKSALREGTYYSPEECHRNKQDHS